MSEPGVDRQARDALAGLIAAYMRGDIRTRAFQDGQLDAPALQDTSDAVVQILLHNLWLIHDDLEDHPICVRRETWEWLRRVLALLATDRQLTAVARRAGRSRQLAGIGGLLLLGIGGAASIAWQGWAPLALAWMVAGLWAMYVTRRSEPGVHPDIAALAQWAPFRSDRQWQAHEHLVGPYGLPPYDPVVHNVPFRKEGGMEDALARFNWLLAGPLAGAVLLPWMLRRLPERIHVVEEER